MTPEQFAFWLHGFAEITDGAHPTQEQWRIIRERLQLVFRRVEPVDAGALLRSLESSPTRELEAGPTPGHAQWMPCATIRANRLEL